MMTKQSVTAELSSSLKDPGRWLIIGVIAVAAFFVLWFARNQIVQPFDELVTERLCVAHGEEIGRELATFERSNRFGLRNRSHGSCSFLAGENGEPAMMLTLAETVTGPMFRMAKIVGLVLQFGVVSIFLRLVVDPILSTYDAIRSGAR